jgi:membrane protein DedA with SNARE-associated domain
MQEFWQFVQGIGHSLRQGGFPDLGIWSYILLVLLAATEGPLSVLLGAAAAAAGYLRPDWVYISAVTGVLIGDCTWYWVGFAGKPEKFMRIGRWLGMHPEHIDKLQGAIRIHAVKLILLAKLSVSLMIPTLVAAGMARVPWRRWLPVVFVTELLWTAMLVWVGYHATGLIARIEHGIQLVGLVVVFLLLCGVIWYVHRLIRREEEVQAPSENKTVVIAFPPHPLVKPNQETRELRFNLDKEPSPCWEPIQHLRDTKITKSSVFER